ncbi:Crp/Fnr family transcriptional regulator [Evansella clarkii]|uniref:Crp/Fnr family transcriptional regulator n=1 Tax=Evansella clarkii TaxID=79879 RepID=UPI000995E8AC|nr:Crp/Fnr family transcriptional regulator [Evansella clarkii]
MSNLVAEHVSWEPFLKYGERKYYEKGSVVYKEKDSSCNGFFYLEEGLVKISGTNHLEEERILDIVCNGKPFGEQAVDEEKYFSTAIAIKNSIIYYFPDKVNSMLLEKDDRYRMLIYNSLTEKLKILSDNVLTASLPSEKLLARKLLTLQEIFLSDQIPFTQQELSQYTNLNRVTVYNIFKKWGNDVISLRNRSITIKNIGVLEKIAAY